MSRFLLMILLTICLLLGFELREVGGKAVVRRDRSAVVGGNNQFAIDLFRALRSRPGNLSLAPASLSTALAMTYEGARGETAEEMARVLHLPGDRDVLHREFRDVLSRLNGDTNGGERPYRLVAANSLWGQQGEGYLPDFTRSLTNVYGAEFRAVDFRKAPEPAREAINGWVGAKTKGLIPELLASNDLRRDTSLVLVNTVYFQADWLHPFAKERTAPGPFRRADGSEVATPLMHQTRRFLHAQGEGFGLLELPYKGGDLAFDVLLPDEGVSLEKVEADLNLAHLEATIDRLGEREVALTLPKFRVTAAADLSETLAKMGMPRAFSDADFRGIDGTRELALSKVVHQVVVKVDEEGTEAAGASAAIIFRTSAIGREPLPFRADRPFLYAIRDLKTGAILFLGRVADPSR